MWESIPNKLGDWLGSDPWMVGKQAFGTLGSWAKLQGADDLRIKKLTSLLGHPGTKVPSLLE